ncbi:hypothetical protein [Phaeovulum sp.]|uniref:hypothetical protein n=1 Tax=Phaeovulum sp. TaxID=2934796 RepID=UPI00351FC29C
MTEASTLSLSHKIVGNGAAVRDCAVCHSVDSRQRAALYRHSREVSGTLGFENAALIQNSYVIGASRHTLLDRLGLLLVLAALAGIAGHAKLRIIGKLIRKRARHE